MLTEALKCRGRPLTPRSANFPRQLAGSFRLGTSASHSRRWRRRPSGLPVCCFGPNQSDPPFITPVPPTWP